MTPQPLVESYSCPHSCLFFCCVSYNGRLSSDQSVANVRSEEATAQVQGEGRKRDAAATNRAALDAKITTAKAWNRFCMTHRESKLFFFMPEHTAYSFEEQRKVRIPNLPLKTPPSPYDRLFLEISVTTFGNLNGKKTVPYCRDDMTRLLCHDYARQWLLKESANQQHRINVEQIDKVHDQQLTHSSFVQNRKNVQKSKNISASTVH